MKSSELKLGDLVKAQYGNILKITEIRQTGCSVCDDEENCINVKFPDDLFPIPLTEEILEKNGFRKNDDDDRILYTPRNTLNISSYKYENWLIYSVRVEGRWDVTPLCCIKYVHELQHILWALGMDDNLKI